MPQHFDFNSPVHFLGLVALGFALLAMSMKNILILRIFSSVANFVYIIYGFLLGSPPLMIGGAIVIAINGYHIRKLLRNSQPNSETS